MDNSKVAFIDLPALKLFGNPPLGTLVFGSNHNAGRVFVEPMYDAGPEFSEPARQLVGIKGEGVYQSAVSIAAGGVNNHIGLLVENNYILILIDDIQRDIFRFNLLARKLRQSQIDCVTGTELKAGLDYFSVDLNASGADLSLDHSPAEVTEPSVEIFIHPPLFD